MGGPTRKQESRGGCKWSRLVKAGGMIEGAPGVKMVKWIVLAL